MKNLWTKFTGLSIVWKVVIIVALFLGGLWLSDSITGGWSAAKGWIADRVYTERMQKVDELTQENIKLKAEKAELEKRAVEVKAKEVVFDAREKNLDAKTKEELDKLDTALAAQDAEEARTAEPVDAFTRCERTKQKMLDLNIKSASNINCEEYK